MTNYYDVLELPERATATDIRRAYLRLVRLTHPDRTPDPAAHQRYLLVNEAYDTLRHPDRRFHYDVHLAVLRQEPARPTTAPFAGNAYVVLRVPYSASAERIEQAYRRLRQALRLATVDPAIVRQLAEVEQAYATLRHPELRRQHDARLRRSPPPRRAAAERDYAPQLARYGRWARLPIYASVVLGLLLCLDLVLPRREYTAILQSKTYDVLYRGSPRVYLHYTSSAGRFDLEKNLPLRTRVRVRRTRLLGKAAAVQLLRLPPGFEPRHWPAGVVRGAGFAPLGLVNDGWAWPVLLLSLGVLGLSPRLRAETRIGTAIACLFTLALTLTPLLSAP